MAEYTLTIRAGDTRLEQWQSIVAKLYHQEVNSSLIKIQEVLTELSEFDKSLRWDIAQEAGFSSFLVHGSMSNGLLYTWKLEIPFTRLELMFGLAQWNAGTNKNIIGHLLMIDKQLVIFSRFDPTILTMIDPDNSSAIYGWDILKVSPHELRFGDGIGYKYFLSIEEGKFDRVLYKGSPDLPYVPMILSSMLTDLRKEHPDKLLADLVNYVVTGEWIEGLDSEEDEE